MKYRKINNQTEPIQANVGCCGTSLVEETEQSNEVCCEAETKQHTDEMCCDKEASKEINSINTGCC